MKNIVGNEQEKVMRKVRKSKYKQLDHWKEKKERREDELEGKKNKLKEEKRDKISDWGSNKYKP